jgi:hypothetical protein
MKILQDILTGKDNKTHDLGRWMGLVSFVAGIALEVYCVVSSKPFDFMGYGVGIGAIAAGVGAMLKLKEDTEP